MLTCGINILKLLFSSSSITVQIVGRPGFWPLLQGLLIPFKANTEKKKSLKLHQVLRLPSAIPNNSFMLPFTASVRLNFL